MSLFFSNKLVRLLLSISVSIWMAGGCLFGCSNTAMASGVARDSVQTIETGDSCHAVQTHDCCAAKKPKKQIVRKTKQPEGVTSFMPTPRGAMNDCPLVVNATAVTSKSSSHVPAPGRAPVPVLPRIEEQTQLADNTLVVPFLPDRGPTYLRCCVFLI